ncbi:UvrB/UvrC motif-containing protein [Gemmata sp. JC717]|uniref:UvrB/UvrC motif-containing protein n=1 Tax=Gemmata algarum TaxID=2975278 RepID=A0ABU5EYY5_9BACT|nr:UvrB/UvrC motif-containing protein [Gemmata algarum]MDY3552065.1 UvrB/UvrC motif-containing protein [Gemmata algarum]MDY3560138.1 UvrB/UvrC motif-containing protein [Gemmata algarum]
MKCQICDAPATFHLTDVVNKKRRELHLCERCARERNLIPEPPGPQIDLKALMGLLTNPFHAPPALAPEPEAAPPVCARCGMAVPEFKATGRLGCPHDYEALRPALEPLLERIHRALAHAGKAPRAVRVGEWKQRLSDAVAAENYEEAARLRDLIRAHE